MTEDEYILLVEICNDFWHRFSSLVEEELHKAPEHLRSHCAMMLQEHASVYGRRTRT